MNQLLTENTHLNLLTWEPNPKKQKENDIITFYLRDNIQVSSGDVIQTSGNNPHPVFYQINHIIEVRDTNLSENKHVTAKFEVLHKINPSKYNALLG